MELVAGEVVTWMPVSGKHGTRAVKICSRLDRFAEQHALGEVSVEVGFLLARNPDSVRAPDVSFVSRSAMPPGGLPEEGFVPYPPTLAVEVSSPNDLLADVTAKVDQYVAAGVERVWVVQPKNKTVTVYQGATARILRLGSSLTSDDAGFEVEGFDLAVADIFA